MDSTSEFVQKTQSNQRNAEHNKKRGKGNTAAQLSNKQHSTNK